MASIKHTANSGDWQYVLFNTLPILGMGRSCFNRADNLQELHDRMSDFLADPDQEETKAWASRAIRLMLVTYKLATAIEAAEIAMLETVVHSTPDGMVDARLHAVVAVRGEIHDVELNLGPFPDFQDDKFSLRMNQALGYWRSHSSPHTRNIMRERMTRGEAWLKEAATNHFMYRRTYKLKSEEALVTEEIA